MGANIVFILCIQNKVQVYFYKDYLQKATASSQHSTERVLIYLIPENTDHVDHGDWHF